MPCSTFLASAISFVKASFSSGVGTTLSALSLKAFTAAFNVLTASSSWVCSVASPNTFSAVLIAALRVLNASSVFLPCSTFLASAISFVKASFSSGAFGSSSIKSPLAVNFNLAPGAAPCIPSLATLIK